VDLCLRVREAGAAVRYCPDSVLYHLESATRGDNPVRAERDLANGRRFRERWAARLEPDDHRYYLEDGLIRFSYRDQGYVTMAVSPLFGRVVTDPPGS